MEDIDCPLCKGITSFGQGKAWEVCNSHMEEMLAQCFYILPNGMMHCPEPDKKEGK